MPNSDPLHVVVDEPSRMTPFRVTVDTAGSPRARGRGGPDSRGWSSPSNEQVLYRTPERNPGVELDLGTSGAAETGRRRQVNESRTIRVTDSGSVSLLSDEKGRTQLRVATVDRVVTVGVILSRGEAVELGLELLRRADPEPFE